MFLNDPEEKEPAIHPHNHPVLPLNLDNVHLEKPDFGLE